MIHPGMARLLSPGPTSCVLSVTYNGKGCSSCLTRENTSIITFSCDGGVVRLTGEQRSRCTGRVRFYITSTASEGDVLRLGEGQTFAGTISGVTVVSVASVRPLLVTICRLLRRDKVFIFTARRPYFVALARGCVAPRDCCSVTVRKRPGRRVCCRHSVRSVFGLYFETKFIVSKFCRRYFGAGGRVPVMVVMELGGMGHSDLGWVRIYQMGDGPDQTDRQSE